MSSPQPLLRLEASEQPDAYVIRAAGELGVSECPDLDAALADAERRRADRIVLDLDRLTFIDAAGLRALLTAAQRLAANDIRLRMTRGRGEVARMFRLTMLDLTLPFTDSALARPDPDAGRTAA